MSNSKDVLNVFNQPLSLEASTGDLGQSSPSQSSHHQGSSSIPDDMGIQRKLRSTLQELLESQPRKGTLEKATQTKLPTPPPTQTLQANPVDHKRKSEENNKEVVETGRTHPFHEVEPQKRAKESRGMQTRSANEAERRGNHRAAAPF